MLCQKFHAISFQNVADRASSDFVAEIGQITLDATRAPIAILFRHAHDQFLDIL